MNKISEDCFFFYNQQGHYLYGCSYISESGVSETGIVIVPPVGHERLRCYRECVTLARELAEAGYSVFRFDYRGEGESYGSFEEFDISSRLEDIELAINEFKKKAVIKNICLLGLRLGAVFSLITASKLDISYLILCEPVLSIKIYARNLIRANIIMQKDYFGKIIKKENELRTCLKEGNPVSIYGFHMSYNFLKQLEEIDIEFYLRKYNQKTIIVYFARKKVPPSAKLLGLQNIFNENGSCTLLCMVNNFSWMTKKIWVPSFKGLSQNLIKWLCEKE